MEYDILKKKKATTLMSNTGPGISLNRDSGREIIKVKRRTRKPIVV